MTIASAGVCHLVDEITRLRNQIAAMKAVVADGAVFTDADHWRRWKEAAK